LSLARCGRVLVTGCAILCRPAAAAAAAAAAADLVRLVDELVRLSQSVCSSWWGSPCVAESESLLKADFFLFRPLFLQPCSVNINTFLSTLAAFAVEQYWYTPTRLRIDICNGYAS